MGLKEDILEMKKEYQEIKEQSLAMELLKDSKKANKRIAISFASVLILTLILVVQYKQKQRLEHIIG